MLNAVYCNKVLASNLSTPSHPLFLHINYIYYSAAHLENIKKNSVDCLGAIACILDFDTIAASAKLFSA